ncbi:MAG: hypothetical protein HY881_26470, partial [Deltaproteobacteria bacterium]|nr:hypothetical protein [Deltaproteobacteria bacterium]
QAGIDKVELGHPDDCALGAASDIRVEALNDKHQLKNLHISFNGLVIFFRKSPLSISPACRMSLAVSSIAFANRLGFLFSFDIIYLHSLGNGSELRNGLHNCLDFDNRDRFHQSLDNQTPDEVYYNLTQLAEAT